MDAKLKKRLGFGSLLIALLVAVVWCDEKVLAPEHPAWASMALLALFSMLAQREGLDLLKAAGLEPPRGLCLASGLAVLVAAALRIAGVGPAGLLGLLLAVVGTLLVGACLRCPKPEQGLRCLAGGVLGVLPVVALASLLDLAALGGSLLVFAVVLTTKSGDIGGYLVGRKWGRRKLIPHVSPGKTWEGSLGGLALSLIVAVILLPRTGVSLGVSACLVLGAVLYVTGLMGDLVESVLKRSAGAKDSGQVLPEFGGVLDMVDSLLLAAPLAAALVPRLS